MRVVYNTATTITGHIADESHSLAWLFAVDGTTLPPHEEFMAGIGAIVTGSTTYEWVLRETELLAHPERWQEFYGTRPVFVFTSRELPAPEGAEVRFVAGDVAGHAGDLARAAGEGDVWVIGGGDLAGQFADAGLLDEIVLSVAPVALAGGAPVLPRTLTSERLELLDAQRHGQFVQLRYAVGAR